VESLTELYCLIDDFHQEFEVLWKHHVLTNGQRKRWRVPAITMPELMTLVVLFHQLRHRQFKVFYLDYGHRHLQVEFPRLPSYSRILELMPRCAAPMAALFELLKGAVSPVDHRCHTAGGLRQPAHRSSPGISPFGCSRQDVDRMVLWIHATYCD